MNATTRVGILTLVVVDSVESLAGLDLLARELYIGR
jgi:hypothetical protein